MKFSEMAARRAAKSGGMPAEYMDREKVDLRKIHGVFTNDAPVMLVNKPKKEQIDGTTKWADVVNKDGETIYHFVAYIPIDLKGEKKVVVTAMWEIVGNLLELIDQEDPYKVVDERRETWYKAEELIEGDLGVGYVDKLYADGNIHEVAVIVAADDAEQ